MVVQHAQYEIVVVTTCKHYIFAISIRRYATGGPFEEMCMGSLSSNAKANFRLASHHARMFPFFLYVCKW